MMPAIHEFLLAVSNSLTGSIIAKLTVVTMLGLIAAWLARGTRAAIRHALLAATFGVTLLLPIAAVAMAPFHVGVPFEVASRVVIPPVVIGVYASPSVTTRGADVRVVPGAPLRPQFSPASVLLAAWGGGVVLFLLPVFIGLSQIRSLRWSALPWRRGQSVADLIAVDLGVRRRIEVLLHEELPGPMTCGVLRPVIVLPRDAETWSLDDLTRAIVHELEHVRRKDSLSRCFARGICAMYWFHPLFWIAWRKLVLEAERSCDDAVLRRSEAAAYADQLVGLAKRLSVRQRSPLLAMAGRADLATRVCAVLDGHQRRGPAGMLSVSLTCLAAAVLVAAISPLTLVAAPQVGPTPGNAGEPIRTAQAQSPAPAPRPASPKWEVTSVKRCEDAPVGTRGGGGNSSPGRLKIKCQSVRGLILSAYVLWANGFLDNSLAAIAVPIEGGPAWIDRERYEINAKAESDVSVGIMQGRMMQALLEDRFKLRVHHRTREIPVYALTVAKGGLKLPRAEHQNCASTGDLPVSSCFVVKSGGPLFDILDMSLGEFARSVLPIAVKDRPVIDKTGIAGRFDFKLEFATDDASTDPSGLPSIFTAVQEQLGLKLEPTKGMGDYLVIDSIERPSEN